MRIPGCVPALYSLRIVKVTSRFATGVIAATGGFAVLYVVVWLMLSLIWIYVSVLRLLALLRSRQ